MSLQGTAAPRRIDSERAALIQQDERARREALDPRRSLLLQAPAGSGKTTVLTARFLTLLAHVDAPEEIVAITFTRKAAAEMRNRILQALQSTPASVPRGLSWELIERARRRDQQLGWQLRQHPARLRIQTVDALNHGFAQSLPVSARTAPSLQISDAPTALYRLAARRALQGAWTDTGTDTALQPAVELLFARLDNVWARLERLTAEMLARRAHWLPHLLRTSGGEGLAATVRQSLDELLRAELAYVGARLPAELLLEGAALLAYAARNRLAQGEAHGGAAPMLEAVSLRADAADLDRWRALVNLARTKDEDWRRKVDRTQGFPADDKLMKQRAMAWIARLSAVPEAGMLLDSVRELPDTELSALDAEALETLARLLPRAAAELKLVFAERGRADHTEMAAAARASLTEQGEPSELALRAGSAIRHILMDEFQDTSLEQFDMLRVLTAGWSTGDGRTLFLVGDPMQSIYQFREAEVGLFLRARDFGLGDIRFEALQLRRNFRSCAALIDWVNERFEPLFPGQDDARLAAIRYLPSVSPDAAPVPPAQPIGVTGELFDRPSAALPTDAKVVSLHRFEDGDGSAEAGRVLEIVRTTQAADPRQSIAVLVASREHAVAIAALLRDAGIAVRGVDLEPLRDRPVIRDVVALTRALLHALDRTAWLALLRAPWCGLTLAQLDLLCRSDQAELYTTLRVELDAGRLPEALRVPVRRLLEALSPALEGAECALPLWQRVQRCWLRLAGPAVHAREEDRLDVKRFIDALAAHDAPETLVGQALAEITDGLYSTTPAQRGAVEIMTMHAAKGLEWDVVLLPGLGRMTASDREPLLHWIDLPRSGGSGTDLLLCPIRCSQRQAPRTLADFIRHIRVQRERIERVRLLYVAATRARRSLHLLGWLQTPAQSSQSSQPPRPLARSPMALLWPAIGAEFLSTPTPMSEGDEGGSQLPAPALSTPPAERTGILKRLPPDWVMPLPAASPVTSPRRAATALPGIAPEFRWVGLTARAVGTIVHAELHRLALSRPLAEADPWLRRVPDYGLWLTELGVPAREHAAAQERIVQALERTLRDPRGRWLLADGHVEARSEWRLTGMHEQRLVTVVFDRMLLDEHGHRWIVDFKTSVHEGAGQAEFIESELERYQPQLQRYATLARALGPQSVRVALYFPLLRVFRELTLPD